VEEGVPQTLAAAPSPELRVGSLTNALVASRGIAPDAARWAITVWLEAVAPGSEPPAPRRPPPDATDPGAWLRTHPYTAGLVALAVVGVLALALALLPDRGDEASGPGGATGRADESDVDAETDDEDASDEEGDDEAEDEGEVPEHEEEDSEEEQGEEPDDEEPEDGQPEDEQPEDQDDGGDPDWPALTTTFPAAASEGCADTTTTFAGPAIQRIGCDVEGGVLVDYLDWSTHDDIDAHLADARSRWPVAHESTWNDANEVSRGQLLVVVAEGGHQIDWTVESTIQSARIFVPSSVAATPEDAIAYWSSAPATYTAP
jgi:hypothetical protein